MNGVLPRQRRRAAALVSAVAILVVVAAFSALYLSVHATHVSTAEAEINRLRAQAAALAGTQITLWSLAHDTAQQADVARVVYEHDTSFTSTPLFQIDGNLAGAAFHVDLWPGEDSVRLKTTANTGGAYYTRWAQMPLTLASTFDLDFSQGFTSQGLQLNGGAAIVGTRLQLTNNLKSKKRSAYWNQTLDIRSFQTKFSFQISNPSGEGMTFVIQNKGLTAVGASGTGLGYKNITKSVAIKFDISGSGAQTNSIGMYTNGAAPTTPYTALSGGVNLLSGHIFDTAISYDGASLAVTLTDHSTGASFSKSFNVNIPSIVGASQAYVGFTGATSSRTATQEILTWTYDGGTH